MLKYFKQKFGVNNEFSLLIFIKIISMNKFPKTTTNEQNKNTKIFRYTWITPLSDIIRPKKSTLGTPKMAS